LPDGSGHEAVVGVGPRHDPIGFDLAVTFRGAAGSARAGCRQLDWRSRWLCARSPTSLV